MMEELEISRVFHEYVLLFIFFTGIVVSVLKGKDHNLPSYLILLLVLSGTLFFLGFGAVGEFYILSSIPSLAGVFPHIQNTFGLLGLITGIFLGALILKIPRSYIHDISLVILFFYMLIHVGCIAGHCREIESSRMMDSLWFMRYSSADIFQASIASIFQVTTHTSILIRIISGLLLFILAWLISFRIRNRKNIMLLSLFMLFLVNFIHQFNLDQTAGILISEKLLGLNIFQWGFLTVNILILLRMLSNEFATTQRQPRLKLKPPPDYLILIFFILLTLAGIKFSTLFSLIDPYLLLMAHIFATVFMVIYLYGKIRIPYVRYATIIIILVAGAFFLSGQFDGTDEYAYGSIPVHRVIMHESTVPGDTSPPSRTGISRNDTEPDIFQIDSLLYDPGISGTFDDIKASRYPYLYDMIYPHIGTENPNGRKTKHGQTW